VLEPPAFAARGELGFVWRMATERGCWAVKQLVGSVEPWSGDDVGFQLAVLAEGVPLPRPVLTREGNAVAVGPDGTGHRVYEWVEFDTRGHVDDATAGELLARIHSVSWPANTVDPWFYEPGPADRWLGLVAAARAAGASWCDLLERHVNDIIATTEIVDHHPPGGIVRCHLDFNRENVMIDRQGRTWVIDWENSGGGNSVQELAQSVFEFAGVDPNAGRAFLAGYTAGGGSVAVQGMSAFSMAFAVQANLVAFYAQRALDGSGADRARSIWRLETILPQLLTIDRAERILSLCGE
jgi:aminoglycoside phosphotransferase (APT) family kinase protein